MMDNRSSVMEVLERVRRREMTPREAEKLWAEQGQDSPIATAPPGGLPRVVWPLSLAFVWIAWRSDAVLDREWERLRYWRAMLEDEPAAEGQMLKIAEARRELGRSLMGGKIVAQGKEAGQAHRTSIEPVEWTDLKFEAGDSPNVVTAGWLQPRWHDVRLFEEDVRKLWPSRDEEVRPVPAPEKRRDKGGALPQYDEIDFLIEAFRIVYDGTGVLTSQADLNRKATEAYATSKGLPAGKPSLEWGKENIRRLWAGLNLERTKRAQ